jgi:putative serine protease PepD
MVGMDDATNPRPPEEEAPTEPVAPVEGTEPLPPAEPASAPGPEPTATAEPVPGFRPPAWWVPALVASWLVTAVLGGVVGAGIAERGGRGPDNPLRPVVAPAPSSDGKVAATPGASDVVAQAAKSVVGIRSLDGRRVGQGTGVVLGPNGDILTNAHVVDGAGAVRVFLPGGDDGREAQVVATDRREDLALLRLANTDGLVPAQLGTSAAVRLGDEVLAIGNALGLRGGVSVTRGIVSGLGRSEGALAGLIQTDAALNPGNSGGPLVDTAGRVIGINTAVRGDAQGVGFAIPIDHARQVLERLRSGKPAAPIAFLGVATREPSDGNPGAQVIEVTPGTAAAGAGLRPGDRLTSFDGKPVAGPDELSGLVRDKAPGDKVEIRFRRGAEEHTATVTLGSRPD